MSSRRRGLPHSIPTTLRHRFIEIQFSDVHSPTRGVLYQHSLSTDPDFVWAVLMKVW